MAKSNGLAWTTLGVGDSSNSVQDIRNDITNLTFSTPRGVQDVTGIDKSAKETLLLLADFSITLNGVFNPAANLSHAVFSTVPSTSVARTVNIVVNTKTLDQTSAVNFTDYALTRAAAGELTWAAPGVLTGGAAPTWS
jgi:Polyubiquitination (PEST) N-terminal domain of MAGUK